MYVFNTIGFDNQFLNKSPHDIEEWNINLVLVGGRGGRGGAGYPTHIHVNHFQLQNLFDVTFSIQYHMHFSDDNTVYVVLIVIDGVIDGVIDAPNISLFI
eukprot:91303_1